MFTTKNSSPLKDRLAEKKIAALLATGRFQDTGARYTPQQATADADNAALRMTATIDGNGQLTWVKGN